LTGGLIKKIFYISKEDFPWDIRTDKICNTLAKEYEVFIICRHQYNNKEIETYQNPNAEIIERRKPIKIIRVGFKLRNKIQSFPISFNPYWKKKLRKNIIKYKPDLLIVREMHLGKLTGELGDEFRIPVIMDMAENYPAAIKLWKKYNNNFLKRLIFQTFNLGEKIEKASIQKIENIITVCDEQHQRLSNFVSHNINFETIYNTPLKSTFTNDLGKLENIEINSITFGHHGYLTAEKNIENLVKAFLILCDNYYSDNYSDNYSKRDKTKNIDFKLIIAGNGDCFDDIAKIIQTSEFKSRVKLLGSYNYNSLDKILDEIDIGVIPYQINEFNNYTIHNKIFDFFAKGIPVIVSEAIPNAKVVNDTNSGIVCDCEDLKLLAEKMFDLGIEINNCKLNKQRHQYSINAFDFYENKYNWENDEKNLLNYISEII